MPARILSGREPAEALLASLRPKIQELNPKLVILQVGEEAASAVYIQRKLAACQRVGMRCEHRNFPFDASFQELLETIERLNADTDVHGVILQLPLPPHLNQTLPLLHRAIHPKKDVDGFTAYNLGKMFLGKEFEHLPPATPAGIIALLEYYNIPIAGKHAVVIGRSNIVGKPLGIMLLNRDATVTICHSKTNDLPSCTRPADILVVAVGKPKMITADMVKPGAVVIDVGISRTELSPTPLPNPPPQGEGKLVGDVDFENVKEVASAITPVPGGIGPMTVASLIRNCVRAAERQRE
ncbi:bifunctional 5,10-methylenetetrahydrofolate dehydrogenase/5,10-methenyltetrahydrofolate cyclohydrolase [Candidatus Peregrinibacteria bacterium]|nr:bifunctional 5,10-methylenetetrahydrofolate dehydrogenase/5,10-methenyltetrahydrofolate cyclohydrolase [Candidatus Peregrinibacteria bacterium]